LYDKFVLCYVNKENLQFGKKSTFLFHFVYGYHGYGLTLWCALGLLVWGTIQVPQLQLQS